ARYVFQGATSVQVRTLGTLPIDASAINTGDGVWRASAPDGRGIVALGWRWFSAGAEVRKLSDTQRVIFDVFPRQQYRFRAALQVPSTPGSYVLELGLLSEKVTWFSDSGSPPVRLQVTVVPNALEPAGVMLAKRKKTVADPPRAILAVTRSGHTYRFAGRILSEGRREADTYLMGQRES